VDYYLFHPDGTAEQRTLGHDLARQKLALMIPGGCWKALVMQERAAYALMVTVITPAWTDDPDRIRIGAGQGFIDEYAGTADWATPAFLRKLIGPNWKDAC
jgi:predicted cupin superfamily sugar epimerase